MSASQAVEYSKKALHATESGELQAAAISHFIAAERFLKAQQEVADDDSSRAFALLAADQQAQGRSRQLESRSLPLTVPPQPPAASGPSTPSTTPTATFGRAAVAAGAVRLTAAESDVRAFASAAVTPLHVSTDVAVEGGTASGSDPPPTVTKPPRVVLPPGGSVHPEVARLLGAIQRLGEENATLLQERIDNASVREEVRVREEALHQRLAQFKAEYHAKLLAAAAAMSKFRETCLQAVSRHVDTIRERDGHRCGDASDTRARSLRALVEAMYPAPVLSPAVARPRDDAHTHSPAVCDAVVERLYAQVADAKRKQQEAEAKAARLAAQLAALSAPPPETHDVISSNT